MRRRIILPGEALAVDFARAVQHDRKAIWWDYGTPVLPNEYVETRDGSACIISIRGSLEHHGETEGNVCGDSYDYIRCRVKEAAESDAHCAIMRCDSPGGVVSGLDETSRWIRRTFEKAGKPLYCFIDELCASAMYALACAASVIVGPRASITGSIGVISTLHDQTRADKAMGLRFVTIASGDRKSDGHPHVAISDDAISAERGRVVRLARQFYRLVSEARPLAFEALKSSRGYEAGIFLGRQATKLGLLDDVCGWDDFLTSLTLDTGVRNGSGSKSESAKGNETDRRAVGAKDRKAMLALQAELKRLKARAKEATDPRMVANYAVAIASLQAAIDAATKITHEKHEKKTVKKDEDEPDGDEGDEGDDDDSEDDGDSEGDDEDEGDESEEEEEDESEEEAEMADDDESEARGYEDEEEAKLALRKLRGIIPKDAMRAVTDAVKGAMRGAVKRRADVGNRRARADRDALAKRTAKLEAARVSDRIDAILTAAKKSGKVTPAEAKSLAAMAKGPDGVKWLKGHLALLKGRPTSKRLSPADEMPVTGADGKLEPRNADQIKIRNAMTAGMTPEQLKVFEETQQEIAARANGAAPRI